MPSRYDVFVSYAEADRGWVEGFLLAAFDEAELRYHHERNFTLGAPRLAEMQRAVLESEYTLLVLSPAYFADGSSEFIDLLAQTYGLETATWPVIPLKLRQVDLPPRLALLQGLDWTDATERASQIKGLCRKLGHPAPPPPPPPACPYVGMAPLSEEDRDRFFGRDQELRELRQRLRLEPFLAVIGPSGSGKSSLVHAGLIPSLREHGLYGSGPWVTRTLRPGPTPLNALAAALGGEPDRPESAIGELLSQHGEKAQLLLVVDQFEELFTVTEEGAERFRFQELLLSLTELPRCRAVVTVRADFYPQLMASPLWPIIQAHRMEVLPLDGDALRQAIMRPAENLHVFVETALVERLVADAAGEPGVLPLVQETLVLLWERLEQRLLPLSAYDARGMDGRSGLAVALVTRANAALADLSPAQRPIARRIFLRLVQLGEGRDDTRRQQPVTNLRSATENPELFDATLKHLTGRRLLTMSGDGDSGDARTVDLAHEALIAAWPSMRGWVERDRQGLRVQRQLSDIAEKWQALGRDPSPLYRGIQLDAAEEWASDNPDAPNALEREFLQASRAAVEREVAEASRRADQEARRARHEARISRRLRVLASGLAGLLVVAITAGWLAFERNAQVQAEAHLVLSRQLAAQADRFADRQPDKAILTGLQSLSLARSEGPRAQPPAGLVSGLARVTHSSRELVGHTDMVTGVAFSLDRKLLATTSLDGTLRLWDVASGQPHGQPLRGHIFPTAATRAFSPDLKLLASSETDGTVRLWDVASGRPHGQPLKGHTDDVTALAFSLDGKLLASASRDGSLRLWDVTSGRPHGEPLRGHSDPVGDVAFSSDGKLLASAASDGTVRLWDVPSGRSHGPPITGHREVVVAVALSPDGKLLASASADWTVGVWNLGFSSWVAYGCKLVGRNLSMEEWGQLLPGLPYERTCPQLPAGIGAPRDASPARYSQ